MIARCGSLALVNTGRPSKAGERYKCRLNPLHVQAYGGDVCCPRSLRIDCVDLTLQPHVICSR